ncbi:MAG: trypsin-like peptidase domain-containing protein [Anaerolineales bacterium]|nr:trypsin-like peptidase domain-containing protein [Anaerolineales bacterium]
MKRINLNIVFAITLLLLTTLACGILSESQNQAPTKDQQALYSTPTPAQSPPNVVVDFVNQQDQLVKLYQEVNPGVVTIRVLSEEGSGLGSGFVIDKEGHIITNFHVVRDATELEIDFPSGFKTRGTILGTDLDSDIAVIKVDVPPEELAPLPLGDSDSVRVGQIVVAIGNPLGYESTMTTGIISSLGRTMQSLHEAPGGGPFTAGDIIQTDAAINPGNSGGPLLNLMGEVIGVNVAIETNNIDMLGQPINSGIGFAVSINIVKRVVPYLITEGSYDYPYLGIRSISELNLFEQETLGLPRSTGVYIMEVTLGSPADKAGLIAGSEITDNPILFAGGDMIIAMDGNVVRDFNEMITYLITHKNPGDSVMLTVLRDDQEIELELILEKRP